MMRQQTWLFGFLVAAIALTAPRSSNGSAVWHRCNNKDVKWPGGLRMHAAEVSFHPGTGTVEYDAYLHAAWNWNQIVPLMDYGWTWNESYIQLGDGYSVTAILSPSYMNGNLGLTFADKDCRGWPYYHSHYTEMDVWLSQELYFQWPNESYNGLGAENSLGHVFWEQGRTVLMHEFGHVLGLDHWDDFDIMRTYSPDILTGGGVAQPLPDDAQGLRALYQSQGSPTNFFASAQGIRADGTAGPVPFGELDQLNPAYAYRSTYYQRGQNVSFVITIGNNGTTAGGTGLWLYVYLSTTPTCDTDAVYLSLTSPFLYPGTYWTVPVGGTLPQGTLPGCYYTCASIDIYNSYTEWNENDNEVHGIERVCVN